MTALEALPPPPASDSNLLAGWDMAFVTSMASVNAELAKQKHWPRAISQADGASSLTATIQNIRLAASDDAAGGTIVLRIDLSNAKATETISGEVQTYECDACTFWTQAELEFIKVPSASTANGKTPPPVQQLSLSSSVSLYPVDFDDPQAPALTAISPLLQKWLDENLGEVAMVFATAVQDLEQCVGGDYGWSLPAALAYSVAIPDHDGKPLPPEDECVFALLGVTAVPKMTGLLPQVRADTLPKGASAAYILSAPLLLSTVVGPAILVGLGGPVDPNLKLVFWGDGKTLTNNATILLPDLDLSDDKGTTADRGTNVRIEQGNLQVSVDGDAIFVSVDTLDFNAGGGFQKVALKFEFGMKLAKVTDGAVYLRPPSDFTGSASTVITDDAIDYQMSATVVCALITAAMAFIPGADEVATGPIKAAENGAISEVTAEGGELAESESASVSETALGELKGALPKLGGYAAALGKKVAIGVGIQVAQLVVCDWPTLLTQAQSLAGADEIQNWAPSLDKIAGAIAGTAWFGSGAQETLHCIDADLNDALVLHLGAGTVQ
jgi:hypothetical protein